ncbi:hypothetical protein [Aquimarina intermedia]|uniref:Dienelactone hydrolase n=1 Tax=Aquimarina intermedia TaxID=350814 RepID=A0A5S5BW28_9FLAO|nr:hypothetical protein [Aquimarina intermedia]TYP70360.1 dienelactone hydrolase [Aquimarina intermedia]
MSRLKPKLIILSDIWGIVTDSWIEGYRDFLEPYFQIQLLDVRLLGGIDLSVSQIDLLHDQFITKGIAKAVNELRTMDTEYVLAFSIGGTIAWKAVLQGLQLRNLYAVSSTRLRKEQGPLNCDVSLFYGGLDANMPNSHWQKKFVNQRIEYPGERHEFYRKHHYAELITQYIIRKLLMSKNIS